MAYSPSACIAVTALGLVAAWLCISLRIYVRKVLLHALQWDDAFATLATIAYTIQGGFYLDAIASHGFGRHITADTAVEDMVAAMKDFFVAELMFVLGTALIKISFALTLLRVVRLRIHIYSLYVGLTATVVIGVTEFFIVLFSCRPISAFWESIADPTAGRCHSIDMQRTGSYAHGAINLFADILIGIIIPIHVLYNVQMQWRVKVSAGVLLSLGSIASIATVMRLYYTSQYDINDFLYAVNVPFLWAGIELAVSIICTSISTLKPLLVSLKVFDSSTRQEISNYDLDHVKTDRGSALRSSTNPRQSFMKGPRQTQRGGTSNSSSDEIMWDGKHGGVNSVQAVEV